MRNERKEMLAREFNLMEHKISPMRLLVAVADCLADGKPHAEMAVKRFSRKMRGLRPLNWFECISTNLEILE